MTFLLYFIQKFSIKAELMFKEWRFVLVSSQTGTFACTEWGTASPDTFWGGSANSSAAIRLSFHTTVVQKC